MNGELAIAALRAGGVGVIDAGLEKDPDRIFKCLDRLERYSGKGRYGLKLGAVNQVRPDRLGPYLKGHLGWLILDSGIIDDFMASGFKKMDGVKLLVECRTGEIPACVKKALSTGSSSRGMKAAVMSARRAVSFCSRNGPRKPVFPCMSTAA